jgi:RNA polymerase sigma-70 factor (ECF subfamily)
LVAAYLLAGISYRHGPLDELDRSSALHASIHNQLERYLHRLYGYAFSLCGNPDEAKDLVQECSVKALAYRAWLFKILRNSFLDDLRRRQRRADFERLETHEADLMEYWDLDDRLINVITVRSELSRLEPLHREIIGLIDISGLSYAEAANTLEIPVGTVMSRISRARAALLSAISEGNIRPLRTSRKV